MQTVAPEKPMTMRHMLSHSGGLTYGMTNHPVDRVYREVGVIRAAADETLATFIEKLAQGAAAVRARRALDVFLLDRRMRLSGRRRFRESAFDQYLQKNIFDPLGMKDTSFHVAEPKARSLRC